MVESMKRWRRGVVELKFLKTITLKTKKSLILIMGLSSLTLTCKVPKIMQKVGNGC